MEDKLRIIAVGPTAISLAGGVFEGQYADCGAVSCIENPGDEELEMLPPEPRTRPVLYSSGEVTLEQLRRVVTLAKIGGRMMACELSEPSVPSHLARHVGAPVLFKVGDRSECHTALACLLGMLYRPGTIGVDWDDIFSLFSGDDYVVFQVTKGNDPGAAVQAIEKALATWRGSIDLFDNYLVSFYGGSQSLDMKEIQEASQLLSKAGQDDANIIWAASLNDQMEGMVQLTIFAGVEQNVPKMAKDVHV